MINEPRSDLDPHGRHITSSTPNKLGLFLDRRSARNHLAELPDGGNYVIVKCDVRALHWKMDIWIAILKPTKDPTP